jgi:hypothetical protein
MVRRLITDKDWKGWRWGDPLEQWSESFIHLVELVYSLNWNAESLPLLRRTLTGISGMVNNPSPWKEESSWFSTISFYLTSALTLPEKDCKKYRFELVSSRTRSWSIDGCFMVFQLLTKYIAHTWKHLKQSSS